MDETERNQIKGALLKCAEVYAYRIKLCTLFSEQRPFQNANKRKRGY